MRAPRIVIAGGGIGGLTAALSLSRRGFEVTVLERSAEFGEIGAGLQLAPNATRVLKSFGLLDDVLDVGVLPDRLVLADAATHEELTAVDVRRFDELFGGPYVVAHRGDLLSILLRACTAEPSIELLAGKAVVAAAEPDEGVVAVECADGSTYTGNALVGADGLRSTVRTVLDRTDPICSGYVAYRGAVPTETVAARSGSRDVVAYIGHGLHFVQYPLRGGRLYNQVAVFRSERYLRGEAEWGTPDELDAAFAATSEKIRTALQAIDRSVNWPMYDRDPLPRWAHGRTVLLGDAAHPMLQYLAQGACQAIQDADCLGYSLAAATEAGRDVVDGFARYQQHRVGPASRTQRSARLWGDMWHSDGLVEILRNAYLRERDPDDLRHVAPFYALAETCSHSTQGRPSRAEPSPA
ncbi:MAG TPA: FAD-dependent oxidoreductase [Jatrophihabitantaceae bacterium]|jgi:salicylate hydroxylase